MKEYLKNVKEKLLATSLQFLLSPFRTKRTLKKILNLFSISITSFLSVYLVVTNIIDYLEFDTVTSIKTIIEKQSDFPTISFCSYDKKDIQNISALWFNNENLDKDWQNHFSVYNDYVHDKCYRFNSGFNMINKSIPLKKSNRPGRDDGFDVVIQKQIIINASSNDSVLLIYIHNHTLLPRTTYNRNFLIAPNTITLFEVKRIYDQKLGYPYNECLKDVSKFNLNKTLIEYMKNNNLEYSQKECNRLCSNLMYNQMNCGCTVNFDDFIYWKCWKEQDSIQKCYDSFMRNFNEQNSCFQYCPLECDSFSYDISVSSTPFYNETSYFKYQVVVYYDDLKYTSISERPLLDSFD